MRMSKNSEITVTKKKPTKKSKYEVGDLVIKTTNMETSLGIIRKIDQSVTTPYFVEWISGFMRGYTSAHSLDHIKQRTKTDRFSA